MKLLLDSSINYSRSIIAKYNAVKKGRNLLQLKEPKQQDIARSIMKSSAVMKLKNEQPPERLHAEWRIILRLETLYYIATN